MFLAQKSMFYSKELTDFPNEIAGLLKEDVRTLLSLLRCHLARALILLISRKLVAIEGTRVVYGTSNTRQRNTKKTDEELSTKASIQNS